MPAGSGYPRKPRKGSRSSQSSAKPKDRAATREMRKRKGGLRK